MKAILLENGFDIDVPKELKDYLIDEGTSWDHYDTRFSFWKENRAKTFDFFNNLPESQYLICSTCFDGYQQLELFVELFHKLKHKKFKFKIMHPSLCNDFIDFLAERESSITPDELEKKLEEDLSTVEITKVLNKIKDFKLQMNQKFFEVLEHHDIYQLSWGEELLLKNKEDLDKHKH